MLWRGTRYYASGESKVSTWAATRCVHSQTLRRRARHCRKIKDWTMKSHRPATHNRKRPVYRDKAKIEWSGTMKRFRELGEDWRIGKLERDIFQQEGASMKTSDDSRWTNKQGEYHKKREEMLDYGSFPGAVSRNLYPQYPPGSKAGNPD